MADNDLEVKFGADISQFDAATKQAKVELSALTEELKRLAAQTQQTNSALAAQASVVKNSVAAPAKEAAQASEVMGAAVASVGSKAHGAGAGFGFFAREAHYMIDELSRGDMKRFEGTLMNVSSTFLIANKALIPWAVGLAAATAALGLFIYKALQADETVRQLTVSAAVGQFSQTAEQAAAVADQFSKLSGQGQVASREIVAAWQRMGEGGSQMATALIPYMEALARAEGTDLAQASQKLLAIQSDLGGAGLKYLISIRGVTTATIEQYKQFVAAGKEGSAFKVILDALAIQIGAVADATTKEKAETEALARAATLTGGAFADNIDPLAKFKEMEIEVTARTRDMTAALHGAANAAETAGNAAAAASARLRALGLAAAGAYDAVGAQSRKLAGDETTLRSALSDAVSKNDVTAIYELSKGLEKLNEAKAKNAQQGGDPLGFGRDKVQQDQDALTHFANTFRGTNEQLLTAEIAKNKAMLKDDSLTAEQRFALQKELDGREKQLWDAQQKSGAKADKDALGAAEETIKGQIRADEDRSRAIIEHLNAEVKLKVLSQKDATNQTIAELNKEKTAVDERYRAELALAGLTATKKKEIENEQLSFDDQIALKIQEAQEKAAEASAKSWKSFADATAGAINGQVNGILKGTTSISQAFKNMAASAIEDIIKFCVKWLAEQAATQAGILASQTAGVAAKKAIDTTSKSSDASTAAAGAYAATASIPIIGPILAPIAAATAFGAVEAFDVGAWSLPRDQLAMVHQGEMIVPSRGGVADEFRGMLSGGSSRGGDTHHWNISSHASDPREVAREVSRIWDSQPSLRPAY